jgi:hypothetical protein
LVLLVETAGNVSNNRSKTKNNQNLEFLNYSVGFAILYALVGKRVGI